MKARVVSAPLGSPSKQAELLASLARRVEMLRGQGAARLVEAELLAGKLKAPADHPGNGAAPGHALSPIGIVVLAAAGLADELEHVLVAIGKIGDQPFAKEI